MQFIGMIVILFIYFLSRKTVRVVSREDYLNQRIHAAMFYEEKAAKDVIYSLMCWFISVFCSKLLPVSGISRAGLVSLTFFSIIFMLLSGYMLAIRALILKGVGGVRKVSRQQPKLWRRLWEARYIPVLGYSLTYNAFIYIID